MWNWSKSQIDVICKKTAAALFEKGRWGGGYHITRMAAMELQPQGRFIYWHRQHQLQIESVSSGYHSCPDYQFHRASDHPQYYHFYRLKLW